jgi:integral membrane protein
MWNLLLVPVGRFRAVSALEGVSYALLVFVAMPLKYGYDMPQMVRVMGMAHGLLFLAFVATLALATRSRRWSLLRSGQLFVASLVPLGALWIERSCASESPLDQP